jgi:hypothetical protein
LFDIGAYLGTQISVDGGGAEAFILPEHRGYFTSQREIGRRELFLEDSSDLLLVDRVQEREKETDRHCLYFLGFEPTDRLSHLVFVQWGEDLPIGRGHPLGYRQAMAALDDRPNLPRDILVKAEIVRFPVAGNVECIPESLGGDRPNPSAVVLQEDVGGDGRSMEELIDFRQGKARFLTYLLDSPKCSLGGVLRGGGDLVDHYPSFLFVHQDQVGKGAPYVYADTLHRMLSLSIAALYLIVIFSTLTQKGGL